MNYSEKPSNSKVQSVFPLATIYSKKTIFFEAGKRKGSRRQKNIHITNRFTKLLVPSRDRNWWGRPAPVGLPVGSRFFDRPVGLPVGSRFFDRPVKPVKTPVEFSFLATKRHLSTNRNILIYFIINKTFYKKSVLTNHTFRKHLLNGFKLWLICCDH